MEISVVICCSDDFDLPRAIESVDEGVEIVAAITPNRLIEQYLEHVGIPYATTPRGNHAVTTNAGLELATGDAALVIDSDTFLVPGTIDRVRDYLELAPVVNLPISFADDGTKVSRTIARLREWDNRYDKPAYKPGIAFRMDVRDRIGGYWYDSSVAWPCDAEMLTRLRDNGVSIVHLPTPGLVHRPIGVRHLLRAYFHYGVGDARRMRLLRQETHWWPLRHLAFRYGSALRVARRDPAVLVAVAGVDAVSLAGIVVDEVRARIHGRERVPVSIAWPRSDSGVR